MLGDKLVFKFSFIVRRKQDYDGLRLLHNLGYGVIDVGVATTAPRRANCMPPFLRFQSERPKELVHRIAQLGVAAMDNKNRVFLGLRNLSYFDLAYDGA